MYKVINLTPEKNATRTIGGHLFYILGYRESSRRNAELDNWDDTVYIDTYNKLSESDWLNFDKIVNESVVFMFVRNPYDRLVSGYIHTGLVLDHKKSDPGWSFDFPITKENQLKCFKNFCMDFAESGGHDDPHLSLQLDVIDNHVKMIGSKFGKPTGKFDNFSIIPYIENKKIFIGKIEYMRKDWTKLLLRFDNNWILRTKPMAEWIGNNSEFKFSIQYKDWYDNELYNLMTPLFKKELEVLDYEF